MGHGEKTSRSVSRPKKGPVREWPRVRHANQPRIASSEKRSAGLISAMSAQHAPNPIQAFTVGDLRTRSARIMAPMMQAAEKLVSQKISGMKASGKDTAQNAPARMA